MTEQGFRGPQVCKIVGITYRQLDYWARTDLVRPSVMDANGSGTQRLYSFRDLLELKVIKQMLDAGLALQSARKAVESLRKYGDDVSSARIVIETKLVSVGSATAPNPICVGPGVHKIVPWWYEVPRTRSDQCSIARTEAPRDSTDTGCRLRTVVVNRRARRRQLLPCAESPTASYPAMADRQRSKDIHLAPSRQYSSSQQIGSC